ncbi:MAG: response regulator [Gammaproteobacteria bacterium]
MAARRALVVDDSKTARVMLRRMLEQHKIVVDTAESAEDALDYLKYERPDVIFMDHMMPGMDGFQALKAIKDDPNTAMIPIMMYTAKGGEVYLGEARALGAVGVLSKQIQSSELVQALRRLHLLEEGSGAAAARPTVTAEPDVPGDRAHIEYPRAGLEQDELKGLMKRLLEEQRGKLKNDMRDSLQAAALNAEVRRRKPLAWRALAGAGKILLIAALVIAGLVAYSIYRPALMRLSWLPWNVEATRAESSSNVNAGGIDSGAPLRQAVNARQGDAAGDKAHLYDAIEWAINRHGAYAFGERALNDARLQTVSELVSRLSAAGFAGRLRIGVHAGQFCLRRNASGGYDLPRAAAPIDSCEIMDAGQTGIPSEADLQSLAFANFLSSSPLLDNDGINVQIVSHGQARPLLNYPARASLRNAGAWNRIARRNNRVEITLIPRTR